MTSRTLFIGWDGADWAILDPLANEGLMPHLVSLRENGSSGVLQSTFPAHSIAAWTSFLTGVSAAEHGIVDFRRCRPGRYIPDVPYDSSAIQHASLPEAISESGGRVLSINIPMTFPPFAVNGALISGVFLPPDAQFTHPPELQGQLDDWGGFPINGLEWAEGADLASLFDEAKQISKRREAIAEKLIQSERWDVAMVAFMAPDRLQHAAMHLLDPAYPASERDADPRDPELKSALYSVYQELDACLGRLIDAASPDTVILASDHGFRSVWRTVAPNRILEELGMLAFRGGRSRLRLVTHPIRKRLSWTRLGSRAKRSFGVEGTIDWSRTVAYNPSAPSQGIRLNVVGRDPRGIVPPADVHSLLADLSKGLREWRLPSGDPGFSMVAVAEEIMGAPATEPGLPDLYLEPGRGVALSGEGAKAVQPSGRRTGEHRREGIIVTSGDLEPLPGSIWEVPHRILGSIGIDRWVRSETDGGNQEAALTAEEEFGIVEHLKGLGYVE